MKQSRGSLACSPISDVRLMFSTPGQHTGAMPPTLRTNPARCHTETHCTDEAACWRVVTENMPGANAKLVGPKSQQASKLKFLSSCHRAAENFNEIDTFCCLHATKIRSATTNQDLNNDTIKHSDLWLLYGAMEPAASQAVKGCARTAAFCKT